MEIITLEKKTNRKGKSLLSLLTQMDVQLCTSKHLISTKWNCELTALLRKCGFCLIFTSLLVGDDL